MLGLVQSMWVEGVLYETLRENEGFYIPRNLIPGRTLQHVDFGDYALSDGADILQIFEDMQRELLILGDPGAGKTILMLQLAEKLISQSQTDPKKPIPVVLNLSSWAAKPTQSLEDWLIAALHSLYPISKKLAETWVQGEKLLLLLDGLDEVAEEHRNACVEAINTFRRRYQSVDMVVCSRIKDYDALTNHLDLRGALLLEGLSNEQIVAYLADPAYDGLRESMATDKTLQSFTQTPFLLNMMGAVYRDLSPLALRLPENADPTAARRDDMMRRFLNLRLHEAKSIGYSPAQARRYLTWLAKNMTQRDQIVFQVEGLQPDWLVHNQKQIYQITVSILTFTLIFVFILIFILVFISASLTVGVVGGVVFGIIFAMLWSDTIEPKMQLQLDLSRVALGTALAQAVFFGVLFGALLGIILDMMAGIVLGAVFGVLFGVILAISKETSLNKKIKPNQGIKDSFKNSVVLGITLGITWEIIFFVFFSISFGIYEGMVFGTIWGTIGGGGYAVLQHILLRFMLTRYGHAPMNYAKFLTHCTDDLHILRRVGGSFLFRHRTLLEYFAAQYRDEDYR